VTSQKEPTEKKETIWAATSLDDGGATEKFRKLMGIKDAPGGVPGKDSSSSSSGILEQQQKLFQTLDQQYEIARMSTHTHRGVGLGAIGVPPGGMFPNPNMHTGHK
jgi:hypothetical protein